MSNLTNTGKEFRVHNYNWNSTSSSWEPMSSTTSQTSSSSASNGNSDNPTNETIVSESVIVAQASPAYNIIPKDFESVVVGGGTASVSNGEFSVTSGTSQGASATIKSIKSFGGKIGQIIIGRFGARFPSSQSNSWQGVGFLGAGDEASFGYNGSSFGIWHRYGGRQEIRKLTLSNNALNGNAFLTLNDVLYNISLSNGNLGVKAKEIAAHLNSNATDLKAWQNEESVYIAYLSDGPKNGTFSWFCFVADGVITREQAGITKTSDFVSQENWNIDGKSDLDPTKGNIYQIKYFSIGYGQIRYSILDDSSGKFIDVHVISNNNSSTSVFFDNQSLNCGFYCINITNETSISAYSSGFSVSICGKEQGGKNTVGFSSIRSVSTSFYNVLTIRNKKIFNGRINQTNIKPKMLFVSSEATKISRIKLIINATLAGNPNFQNIVSNSLAEYDTDGTSVSGGVFIAAISLPPSGSAQIDLSKLNIEIPPSYTLSVAALVSSGSAANISADLTWEEDI